MEKPPIELHQGDRVTVVEDNGQETKHVVQIPPWKLWSGQWVVGISGKPGGFLLSRVTLDQRLQIKTDNKTR